MAKSSQAAAKADRYDLLLLADATSSMSAFLKALNKSLPEIVALSALTGRFERIGVACYRDYCDKDITEWSGWCSPSGADIGQDAKSEQEVLDMAKELAAIGGEDTPEAAKSGLALAYSKMRPDATTIIILFADAPPHSEETGGKNHKAEVKALSAPGGTFSEKDAEFMDLANIGKLLRHGEKRSIVFPILYGKAGALSSFMFLSTITGGTCLNILDATSVKISKATIGLLLAFMGMGGAAKGDEKELGNVTTYKKCDKIDLAKTEKDLISQAVLAKDSWFVSVQVVEKNLIRTPFSIRALPALVEARAPEVMPLEARYKTDTSYQTTVIKLLRYLISVDVSTISLNPVFGGLWREVCKDRLNPARAELVHDFSTAVEQLKESAKKERLKIWLELSYNYSDEVNDIIAGVEPEDLFPALYLDPTLDFSERNEEDGSPYKAANQFTRGELLEINRSCDQKTTRRIGKILTMLSCAESEEDLPAHIKVSDPILVPRIPLALISEKYDRQFWQVLLHTILPGTMLSMRGAALVAALSLRMSILPLQQAAETELFHHKSRWNDLRTPENWSFGCLNLLLQVDADFEQRVAAGTTTRLNEDSRILSASDRALFSTMVEYKMMQFNMDTTVQALVGWTPKKDKSAIGPLVICKMCNFPRSVTIMAPEGICCMCSTKISKCGCTTCSLGNLPKSYYETNVSKDVTSETPGHWVECCNSECLGQYIVYNPQALNVRAKCFYCRHPQGTFGQAPTVQCHKCGNRIIWPEEYRPDDLDWSTYSCAACISGKKSLVEIECTARDLARENGTDWLLKSDDSSTPSIFTGKSLYSVASKCNLETFAENVVILPGGDIRLKRQGKDVKNTEKIRAELSEWITARKTQQGSCGLCFSDVRKSDLVLACGRSGCPQQICMGCRDSWYSLNAIGRIINTAALSCPFCRRHPTPKNAAKYRLTSVGNLAEAVTGAGEWIYGWCRECGFAKRHIERVCAAGAPIDTGNFECSDCIEAKEARRLNIQKTSKSIHTMSCPSCNVLTHKSSGCDHITCPCGTHWCYECGAASTDEGIYRHISVTHGGLVWGW